MIIFYVKGVARFDEHTVNYHRMTPLIAEGLSNGFTSLLLLLFTYLLTLPSWYGVIISACGTTQHKAPNKDGDCLTNIGEHFAASEMNIFLRSRRRINLHVDGDNISVYTYIPAGSSR